ncbi:putative tRNA adenosine deaminase-associated protein [Lipingzhangella halophila]|uniref:Putative tRNA adenosine deaminase-associated protein n=1 Tax=Lipingzhangella halophila TaxID=1783352 RepID=A0A7W7W6W7_9ACTN|nr:tRNA adenosine deaminase-associated protein [Lipingzhangella halophila]MBB4935384.1 putative tRNA adenosine deaminase-associated protein [Lipingzhangella halophila]
MSIFAAVFCLSADTWMGTEVDLDGAESIDDVADLMRDVSGAHGPDAAEGTMLLLIEADDEWFGLVRVDDHSDPQVFLSDARVVHEHPVAELLLESGEIEAPEQVEGTGQKPYPNPGGTGALLSDIGTSERDLLSLTLSEGILPGDVLSTVAARAGFADYLDSLRL